MAYGLNDVGARSIGQNGGNVVGHCFLLLPLKGEDFKVILLAVKLIAVKAIATTVHAIVVHRHHVPVIIVTTISSRMRLPIAGPAVLLLFTGICVIRVCLYRWRWWRLWGWWCWWRWWCNQATI